MRLRFFGHSGHLGSGLLGHFLLGLRRGLGGFGLDGLGLGVERTDLQLCLVLLENAFVVVFPELLRGVLAGNTLQDLLAACNTEPRLARSGAEQSRRRDAVKGREEEGKEHRKRTRMVILELAEVVNVAVHDDVEIFWLVVRRNVAGREGLRHDGQLRRFGSGGIKTKKRGSEEATADVSQVPRRKKKGR